MSEVVKGRLSGIKVDPGRADVIVYLDMGGFRTEEPYSLQPGGKVTFDGVEVATTQLPAAVMLAAGDVTVTLHPITERYDASTDAEFVIAKE